MRIEYKEGDLLTKEDIGLVFKTKNGIEVKIQEFIDDIFFRKPQIVIGYSEEAELILRYNIDGKINRYKKDGSLFENVFDDYDLVLFVGKNGSNYDEYSKIIDKITNGEDKENGYKELEEFQEKYKYKMKIPRNDERLKKHFELLLKEAEND